MIFALYIILMTYLTCPGDIDFATCTWLYVHGKRDIHEKGVHHWHVPHVHIHYIQTLFVHYNVCIKASIGYGL